MGPLSQHAVALTAGSPVTSPYVKGLVFTKLCMELWTDESPESELEPRIVLLC